MVHRSASRYVHYTSSVTNMLRELKWSTLEQGRNQASLIMLHKIQNKQVNVHYSHLTTNFFVPHSKPKHHVTRSSLRLYELPTEIKDAPTVPALKFCK